MVFLPIISSIFKIFKNLHNVSRASKQKNSATKMFFSFWRLNFYEPCVDDLLDISECHFFRCRNHFIFVFKIRTRKIPFRINWEQKNINKKNYVNPRVCIIVCSVCQFFFLSNNNKKD